MVDRCWKLLIEYPSSQAFCGHWELSRKPGNSMCPQTWIDYSWGRFQSHPDPLRNWDRWGNRGQWLPVEWSVIDLENKIDTTSLFRYQWVKLISTPLASNGEVYTAVQRGKIERAWKEDQRTKLVKSPWTPFNVLVRELSRAVVETWGSWDRVTYLVLLGRMNSALSASQLREIVSVTGRECAHDQSVFSFAEIPSRAGVDVLSGFEWASKTMRTDSSTSRLSMCLAIFLMCLKLG